MRETLECDSAPCRRNSVIVGRDASCCYLSSGPLAAILFDCVAQDDSAPRWLADQGAAMPSSTANKNAGNNTMAVVIR